MSTADASSRHEDSGRTTIRPLLKWAGGKRQLLPALRPLYPHAFDRYVEPFLGSGAVFFDLYAAGRLEGRAVRLVDSNPDLIGCYRAVRDDPDAVIDALQALEREHRARGAACYYEVRDCRFNPARTARASRADAYTPALAAMFIYLNRTGFNGLFRVNQRGAFNVPAGRYVNPIICDPGRVQTAARALSARGLVLECAPFDAAIADARRGDFVYCDPPYAPLSRTASFAHYTPEGFGTADHLRLRDAVVAAACRGALMLLSNSHVPEIESAYGTRQSRVAGLEVRRVQARRAINARAARRGPIDELIVTNAGRVGGGLRMARAAGGRSGADRALQGAAKSSM